MQPNSFKNAFVYEIATKPVDTSEFKGLPIFIQHGDSEPELIIPIGKTDPYGIKKNIDIDTTKLYRAVSKEEYKLVIDNKKFVPFAMAMEEKWFATSKENAKIWGDIFYPNGEYKILEIEVFTESLKMII